MIVLSILPSPYLSIIRQITNRRQIDMSYFDIEHEQFRSEVARERPGKRSDLSICLVERGWPHYFWSDPSAGCQRSHFFSFLLYFIKKGAFSTTDDESVDLS